MSSSLTQRADPHRLADRYGNPGVPVLATPHLAATPAGMRFTMTAVLTKIDRRRLVFSVEARDEAELVCQGTHERFVVETAPFLAKAAAKTAGGAT